MENKLTLALFQGPVEPRPKPRMKVNRTSLNAKRVEFSGVCNYGIGYGGCGPERGMQTKLKGAAGCRDALRSSNSRSS